jgi:hypothetical protein
MPGVLLAARRALGRGFFFLGALFAFGFATGIFFMSCPSCCGNALMLTANIRANAPSVRSPFFQLPGRFMFPPFVVRRSERRRL